MGGGSRICDSYILRAWALSVTIDVYAARIDRFLRQVNEDKIRTV